MKGRGDAVVSLWTSIWNLCLLWLLCLILPDVWTALAHGHHTSDRADASPLIQVQGQGLDCTWIQTPPDLAHCVAAAGLSPEHPLPEAPDRIFTFIPVHWADVESRRHAWNWTDTDYAVDFLQARGLTPVLVLDTVPAWRARKTELWDRDHPGLPSSHPEAFAHFAERVAQRYRKQVRHYQLGRAANRALEGHAYAVSPVRYGQMVAEAAPRMKRAAPVLQILSAPILPVTETTLTDMVPELWLARLWSTGAGTELDIVLWSPYPASAGTGSLMLHRNPLSLVSAPRAPHSARVHWLLTRPLSPWLYSPEPKTKTEPDAPFPVMMSAPEQTGPVAAPDRHNGILHGLRWPGLSSGRTAWLRLAWLAVLLWSWHRAGPALRLAGIRLVPARVQHWPPFCRQALFLGSAAGITLLILVIPWWPVVCLLSVCLLGLALHNPAGIWYLTLAALPFEQVHADLVTPLLQQRFPVSPAQILTLALLPAMVRHLYRNLRFRHSAQSLALLWLLLGWLLLLGLGHASGPEAGRLGIMVQHALFPWSLALASLGIGLDQGKIRHGLEAMALGVVLFAFLALGDWAGKLLLPDPALPRLAGLTFSPNHAAMILLRGFWLAWILVQLHHAGTMKKLALSGTAAIGLALLFTFSRGALGLGVPAALLLHAVLRFPVPGFHILRDRSIMVCTGTAILGIATGLLLPSLFGFPLLDRILDRGPIAARGQIWHHTIPIILEHPWFGQGSDGFYWSAAASFPYSAIISPEIAHPHNVWLEILVQWGVAGAAWMLVLTGLTIWHLRTPPMHAGRAWLGGAPALALVSGLAHAQVDAFWALPDIAAMNLVLWLLLLHSQPESPHPIGKATSALSKARKR